MHRVQHFDHVIESHREPLGRFAAKLQEVAYNALGWTLYGEIIDGTFEHGRHPIRSVLMLRAVDLDLLRRLGALGEQFGRFDLAPPLVMTPAFLDSIRDTFPLELIEIQQAYLPAFGPDFFAELKFAERDVRLQCERELDVLLIGLQQGLLAASGIEDRLALLQKDWVGNLLRTLRGLLWLKGRKERTALERTLDELARIAERPLDGIRRLLATTRSPGWQAFHQLHADVEALGAAVNGW